MAVKDWFKAAPQPSLPGQIAKLYADDPRLAMAQQLMGQNDFAPVRTPIEGLSKMVAALSGAYIQRKTRGEYGKRGEAYRATMAEALKQAGTAPADQKLNVLAQALSGNADTADLGTETQIKLLLQQAENAAKQGRMVTAEEMSALTGGAISAPGYIGPDGKPEILEPPKLPSYAPNSTIMGYGGQSVTLDNAPPNEFRNWGAGPDPRAQAAALERARAGAYPHAMGEVFKAGVDQGGELGDQRAAWALEEIRRMSPGGAAQPPMGPPMQPQARPGMLNEQQGNAAFTAALGQDALGPPGSGQYPPRMDRTGMGQDISGMSMEELSQVPVQQQGYKPSPTKAERLAAEAEAKARAEAQVKEDVERPKLVEGVRQQIEKAKIVESAVDKAIAQTGYTSAGIIGQATRGIGQTPAYNLEQTIAPIKANLGFKELADMRAASPTGGALGQVAVKELDFLQASIASLDTAQSPAQLKEALTKVKTHYNNWRAVMQQAYPELASQPAGGANEPIEVDW